MPYRVEVTPKARRDLRKLPASVQAEAVAVLEVLGDDPRPSGSKPLVGKPLRYSVRVAGVYRIIYRIEDDVCHVDVVRVGHRKNVYKDL